MTLHERAGAHVHQVLGAQVNLVCVRGTGFRGLVEIVLHTIPQTRFALDIASTVALALTEDAGLERIEFLIK